MDKARVFVLSGRRSQEIPAGWYAARHGEEPEFVRECCVEVAPGVLVRLLGHGDCMLPDGTVVRGAQIAVWSDPAAGVGNRLTLAELLAAVEAVDANIDACTAAEYRAQPLAADWARVTKVCEESGEVWRALSKWTGENPRKGVCGTLDDLLGELGDTASAAICAIQHLTKDTGRTWEIVSAAFVKARDRISEYAPPAVQHSEFHHPTASEGAPL